jgi:hypothetical protein
MPIKVELEATTPGLRANIQGDLDKPLFFLYGNVVEIPKDTWHQLKQLYSQPSGGEKTCRGSKVSNDY